MNPMNVSRARTARLAVAKDVRVRVYTSETGVPTQRDREREAQRRRMAAALADPDKPHERAVARTPTAESRVSRVFYSTYPQG